MTRQRLRPSQIITTFGPGSIVDLPDDSVMIAGTEHWFDGYKPHRKISEPRLQAALRVVEFRTPPVGSYQEKDIPFVRFPRWRVCPKCERLSSDFRFPRKGDLELPPVPRCDRCNCETYPARLIVACAKGHIDDFPWYRWLHRGQNCGGGNNLYLRGEGKSAALSDLKIECTCGITPRTLAGAMSREAMSECGVRCNRKRPWLNDDPDSEDCGATRTRLYVLQRGASNVYFSVVRSRFIHLLPGPTRSRRKSRRGGASSRRRFRRRSGRKSSGVGSRPNLRKRSGIVSRGSKDSRWNVPPSGERNTMYSMPTRTDLPSTLRPGGKSCRTTAAGMWIGWSLSPDSGRSAPCWDSAGSRRRRWTQRWRSSTRHRASASLPLHCRRDSLTGCPRWRTLAKGSFSG